MKPLPSEVNYRYCCLVQANYVEQRGKALLTSYCVRALIHVFMWRRAEGILVKVRTPERRI